MSVVMEMHQEHVARRSRMGMPVMMVRGLRATLASLPPPTPRVEPEVWGCPLNMLTKPTPRFLIKLVSVRRSIPVTEMTGRCKTVDYVAARDEALALIYTHCRAMSLPELGRLFGGRDHTTILHSLRKMRRSGKPIYRVFPGKLRSTQHEEKPFTS
jgi:hypothetical protein